MDGGWGSRVEVRLLGPIEVSVDGVVAEVALALRALLARLVLAGGATIPSDRLLEDLWPAEDPERALNNLRVAVSRLRRALTAAGVSADVVVTRPPGYTLELPPESTDVAAFDRLVRAGRERLAAGEAQAASDALHAALGLWRGPALADVADRGFAVAEAVRLDNARLDALEERIEADLAIGRHGALAPELEALTRRHPLRERLWAQRMTAEYRAGQQAAALRTCQELRSRVREELGIEPSPAVQRLEHAILRHDPSLEWSPPPGRVAEARDPSALGSPRVLLVDDHPLWRAAVRNTLERDGIDVVGEAEDGIEAVKLVIETEPDVVLMDLHLPGMTGTEAARSILSEVPTTSILMLSASGEEGDVLDAVEAGARGYLVKAGLASDIVDGVRRAAAGETVFSGPLAGVVLERLRARRSAEAPIRLSSRQRELLKALAAGDSLPEAAAALMVDAATVHGEIIAIVERLQGVGAGAHRALRTIVFVDVVDSTGHAAAIGDLRWREVLDAYHQMIEGAAGATGGSVVKRTGDGALVTFTEPGRALTFASRATTDVRGLGIEARAGLHMGECEVTHDDVSGLAVHIAARVSTLAGSGEVLVSHTLRELMIGSEVRFHDRGEAELRGVPGTWRVFAAVT